MNLAYVATRIKQRKIRNQFREMTTSSARHFLCDILRLDKNFTIRNLFAWLCLCATLTVLNYSSHGRGLDYEMASNFGLLLCGLIGTHLMRIIILSAGKNAPWRSIYIHAFLIGLPISSFLMSVLALEYHAICIYPYWDDRHFSIIRGMLGVWFFMVLLFGGWAGVYVSSLAVKRSNEAEVDRLETETALRDAELRALKAQINPHFLFNSLNTIRALVNEHPERAQEAVLHLSLILRASLQSERMLRSVRDEIATTRHYLELEKIRFEERLQVSIQIAPAAMEAFLPTMILQTLVENAIKHGIGTMVKGGILEIKGDVEGNRLIISITNPGRIDNKNNGTGLGLSNARMRLQRMIGQDARLDIRENEGIVTARLDLPIKRDDKSTLGR
jgi:two-component sensor histidine kinase